MEGVCIYINSKSIPTILMYKELDYGLVFVIFYNKNNIYGTHITCKTLTDIFPRDHIHILYKLPYNHNYEIMATSWRNLVKERLLFLNNSSYQYSHTLVPIPKFEQRFKKKFPPFKLC